MEIHVWNKGELITKPKFSGFARMLNQCCPGRVFSTGDTVWYFISNEPVICKMYVLRDSKTGTCVWWEIKPALQSRLCAQLPCWVPGKQEQVAGLSFTHFTGFGISCREDEDLGNGSASLENSGFEKEQQISSMPRIFSRKWNIFKKSEKKCIGYVFHMSIIRFCKYSFTCPADPYKLFSEWRLSQVIFFCKLLIYFPKELWIEKNQHTSFICHAFNLKSDISTGDFKRRTKK